MKIPRKELGESDIILQRKNIITIKNTLNKFNGRFNILKRELISKKRGQNRLSTYSKKRQIDRKYRREGNRGYSLKDLIYLTADLEIKSKERNGAKTIFKCHGRQNFPEQIDKT